MTIREAQRLFERMDQQVDDATERGFKKVLDRGLALARKQTSGRRSLSELRRRDYPYAKRHGSPRLDPAKVNSQSGDLLSRWFPAGQFGASTQVLGKGDKMPGRVLGSGTRDLRGSIVNDDPVTEFLEGTTIMFPRPVAEAVEKKLEAEAESIVAKAVQGVLSRYAT